MRLGSEGRLGLSLALSWMFHALLALAVWSALAPGSGSPRAAMLELIGPAESASGGAPSATPSAPRPRRVPSRPEAVSSPPAEALRPAIAEPAAPPAASVAPAPTEAEAPASASGPVGMESDRVGLAASGSAEPRPSLIAPRAVSQPIPRYPESARREGAQGTTVLRARVLADGSVGEVLVEQSAGHPLLDAAALESIRRWRFEPARRGGEPVPAWILLPVRFTLG